MKTNAYETLLTALLQIWNPYSIFLHLGTLSRDLFKN